MKTKRFLALLLATVMLLSAIAFNAFATEDTPDTPEVIAGDVDGDGKISTKDLLILRNYFANYNYETGSSTVEISAGADMNKDGNVDTLDVIALRKWLTENDILDDSYNIPDVMIGETIDAEYAADFSVAKVFSDNMVVQRNEHIRVWGFAPESENGKKVSGEFKGMFAEALIENGEWCITFTARLKADTKGAEMKIYTDNKTVTFNDVLVGDVYLVMGQSNAAYNVEQHLQYDDPATQGGGEDAIDPNSIIRLNYLNGSGGEYSQKGTDYVYSDLENTTFWTKTTTNATKRFSALGYYFARHLTEKNPGVPVGLMEVAKGGAPLVSFLPSDLAEKHQSDYFDVETGKYYSNITKEHMGRYFYNCYLAPVEKYALAGVVWYQGESNNSLTEASAYNAAFADFVTRLRSTHNVINKDFPVFITELPSIYQKPANYTDTWYFMELGIIRSYMGSIPTILKNSYVAPSSDLWNDRTFYNNLHPNCKYEQAERLAAIAGAVIYRNVYLDAATGPVFESATVSADRKTVTLIFTNVGAGLTTADGGNEVLGIVGFNANRVGHVKVSPVSATITAKDQITVVFDSAVKGVAYNYESSDFYGETVNLCNSFGTPATAFITPYDEIELGQYDSDDFMPTTYAPLNFKAASMDSLKVNGNSYFSGGISSGLQASGNKVEPASGSSNINLSGWAGFGYENIMFGYSIDGGNAVWNSYPVIPEQAVKNAGGEYANRFSITVPLRDISVGEHKVDFLVLVDLDGGVAVKLLSFTLVISKSYKAEDFKPTTDSSVNFKKMAIDSLKADGVEIFKTGYVSDGLKSTGNKVSVNEGTSRISTSGWAGFTGYDILKFGYSIDGGNAVFHSNPNNPSDAVKNAGGEKAKGYAFNIDISNLSVGDHHIYLLALVDVDGGVAVKLLGFTLTIVDQYTFAELLTYNDPSVNYINMSLDSLSATGGTASGNTIRIPVGTGNVAVSGWAGFEGHEIIMFGYAVIGENAVFNTYPSSAESGVQNAGGALAKRFTVNVNTADFAVGQHGVVILALIEADGRVGVQLMGFIIEVTE